MTIYYDTATGHRLEMLEIRGEHHALFEDLDAAQPTTLLCRRDSVDLYPRAATAQQMSAVLNIIGQMGRITHVRPYMNAPTTETRQ